MVYYQIDNPPDGYRYYKIIGNRLIFLCHSSLSKEFIRIINEFRIQRMKTHRK